MHEELIDENDYLYSEKVQAERKIGDLERIISSYEQDILKLRDSLHEKSCEM